MVSPRGSPEGFRLPPKSSRTARPRKRTGWPRGDALYRGRRRRPLASGRQATSSRGLNPLACRLRWPFRVLSAARRHVRVGRPASAACAGATVGVGAVAPRAAPARRAWRACAWTPAARNGSAAMAPVSSTRSAARAPTAPAAGAASTACARPTACPHAAPVRFAAQFRGRRPAWTPARAGRSAATTLARCAAQGVRLAAPEAAAVSA
jgi:hypothetical protein